MSQHIVSVKVYASVLLALLSLLALTVAAGLIERPAVGLSIALSIASIKAVLIVLFFMHVRYDTPVVRLAAVAGFLWLALLIGLSMSDFLTRHWPPATEIPASGTRNTKPT
jgi:cytochrome c oxidase subunit 4